eukprot:TRINITY_DN35772_c0_g1_i1.p2 TRINITY_DN35772_c0_g1~~TRINITY_DN35772_c0_g1_i1.p2  ORF type:complete len:584 (-),score=155.05 TRINITY_DN35772_c0_g1_i1:2825-4576(-)
MSKEFKVVCWAFAPTCCVEEMGNSPVAAASAANAAVSSATDVAVSEADRNQAAKEHFSTEREDGKVECSCGFVLPDLHVHKLHIEAHAANMKPMQSSGWPQRHFQTVPHGDKIQKGIVAKGDIANGIFMTVALKPDFNDQEVRAAVSSIEALGARIVEEFIEDPELRTEEQVRLITIVGVAAELWKKWDALPPNELIPFTEKVCPSTGQVIFPSSAENIFLMIKAQRQDICYEVAKRFERALGSSIADSSQYVGFRYGHGIKFRENYAKDLTGFIDGTRNPDHVMRAIVDNCVIFEDDDEGRHIGGSYMYAGRFVHDLKAFERMDLPEKNQVIGREYNNVEPHVGYDQRPENPRLDEEETHQAAHVYRAFGSMHRHAMPYRLPKEEGLFFVSVARSLTELNVAIERMAGLFAEDGSPDNLFKITRSVSNNYFYVPSAVELEQIGKLGRLNVQEAEAKEKIHGDAGVKEETKEVVVIIEYCTNCGYSTIFKEKKKVLERVYPGVKIIPNPKMPRLSGFEITTFDGVVLWSKLSQPDGRNNYPHVFPTNLQLENNFRKYLGMPEVSESAPVMKIYDGQGTRVGVW